MSFDSRAVGPEQSDSVELPFLVYASLMRASAEEPALRDDLLFRQFLQAAYDRFVEQYEVLCDGE